MNSEFPENRFSKIFKKLGWLFSPLLLLTLFVATIITAERLNIKVENQKITIEQRGLLEVNEPRNANIKINSENKGKTPQSFDIPDLNNIEVELTKDGRTDWKKTLTVKPGFVKTIKPILYPKDMDFESDTIYADKVYPTKGQNLLFYTTLENNRLKLYKYSILKELFGIQSKNEFFADLTNLIKKEEKDQTNTEISFKNFDIYPSNTGKYTLLNIENEKLKIIDERGNVSNLNIISTKNDKFHWSNTDKYLILETPQEIYSIETSSNRTIVINKSYNQQERNEIQFLLENTLVYKITDGNTIELLENSFDGNSSKKIDLPNIDNIRKNNLLKAYDFTLKEEILLIQTKENIYSYNVKTNEFKKFNIFAGEEIVFVSQEKESVITINKANNSQFRSYDLKRNENSKTFKINDIDENTQLTRIFDFINSQEVIFQYDKKIIFTDVEGANQISYTKFHSPEIEIATKIDNSINIVVKNTVTKRNSQGKDETNFALSIERFDN